MSHQLFILSLLSPGNIFLKRIHSLTGSYGDWETHEATNQRFTINAPIDVATRGGRFCKLDDRSGLKEVESCVSLRLLTILSFRSPGHCQGRSKISSFTVIRVLEKPVSRWDCKILSPVLEICTVITRWSWVTRSQSAPNPRTGTRCLEY